MKKIIIAIFEKFCSPKEYIKNYLRSSGGSIEFADGTFAVHQSKDFHEYCYQTAYPEFKSKNSQ